MISIFFLGITLIAQDSTAYILKSQGDSLYKAGNLEDAHSTFLKALNKFEEDNNWKEWAGGFYRLERTTLKMRDIERIDSLNLVYSIIPKEEVFVQSQCHYNIAYAYGRMGHVYQSIKKYENSLEGFLSLKDSTKTKNAKNFVFSIYNSLSVSYSRLGDQKNALKYANQGVAHSLITEGNPRLCQFQSLKGKYFFNQEKFNKALKQYKKVLNDCGEDISLHNYLAELYLKLDSFPKAKFHIDRLKNLNDIEYGEQTFHYYLVKSEYNRKLKLHDQAIVDKKTGLKLLAKTLDSRTYTKELSIFSDYLFRLGKKEQSLLYAQQALSLFFTGLDIQNVLSRPMIGEVLPDVWITECLGLKAKYFKGKYLNSKDSNDLDEAKFYYDALFHYFDKTKGAYSSTSEQYSLGTYTQKIYSESIQFYSNLYNQEKNIEFFEKAFALAQNANAYVLKNSVSERRSLELAGVPQDTLNKYVLLKALAGDSDEDDPNAIKYLNQFKSFENQLKLAYPAIDKIQKDHIISLSKLQSVLDTSSMIVKYYYWNSKLTRFTITNKEVQLDDISLPEYFNLLIVDYQNLVSDYKNWNAKKYEEVSKEIYSIIIEDILNNPKFSNHKHLIIAPDGPIKKIAFNSLVTKDSNRILQADDYLVYNYEISYLYYCAQLNNDYDEKKDANGFIGFGIEYNDEFLDELVKEFQSRQTDDVVVRSASLSPLKYAKTEAVNSALILEGVSILNEDATLTNVLANINNFNLIHFSAHAFVDNSDYMNSFIALSKDRNEEYQLKYEDILNLNLDSELVVLSACQTGSGKSISGEGLMSLSRAFVQSGCKTSMGAYWNAPDLSTMQLMELFYSNLKEGMTKSNALRQAQIEYLENEEYATPRTSSPFFWSTWAIYGDSTPIPEIKSSNLFSTNNWIYTLFGLLVIFITIGFWYKRAH